MRVWILAVMMFLVCITAQAQRVAEFKGVEIDEAKGSVKVLTQYVLNSQTVDVGGKPCNDCIYVSGRYDEAQGTLVEIIALNDYDTNMQCEILIKNQLSQQSKDDISTAKLAERKKQNQALRKEFKKEIGKKVTVAEVKEIYKQIEVTINADKTINIVDIP